MKKTVFAVVFGVFAITTNVNAQAVEEGNVLIDAYYGFPDLYKATFKTAYANSGSEIDLKMTGLGPLGGRVEYLLTDKVGLGLDVVYNSAGIEYKEFDSFDNTTYEYDFTTTKIGALVMFNFHFVDNDQLDVAGVVGAGYSNRNFKFSSTDPNYSSETITGLVPVGFKLGVIMRYFFTDNIGMNLGVGLGQGGLLNGGLSVKF
jgi:outer membrane protein W